MRPTVPYVLISSAGFKKNALIMVFYGYSELADPTFANLLANVGGSNLEWYGDDGDRCVFDVSGSVATTALVTAYLLREYGHTVSFA